MQKLIEAIRSLNWKVTLFGGLILSICSAGIGSIAELITVLIIPALLIMGKYFAAKLPKWLDEALDRAIPVFFACIILTFLIACFEGFTGTTLIRI